MAFPMKRQAAAAAAILSAPLLGAASAASRTPVPGGQGCNAIKDRAACCLFVDGRQGGEFGGQDCVPSKEGFAFTMEGAEGEPPVCQPSCWALGTCSGGQAGQAAKIETCPANSAATLARILPGGKRLEVPGGLGCDSVGDRTACCAFMDGRAEYAGQECVPARGSTYFLQWGSVCEAKCKALGTCGGPDQLAYTGFCAAPPVSTLPSPAVLTQAVARIPAGGDVRFYVVGSSNSAWQNWPDQTHAALKRLGYNVVLPSTEIRGEAPGPVGRRTPKCEDADTYEPLSTPRLALQGWSSWGFAYESEDDCNEGFRTIAGWNVKCTNGWACSPEFRGDVVNVPPSVIAKNVRGAHVVVLANWVNDGRTAQYVAHECYGSGEVPDPVATTAISAENLRRTIRAIHAEDPEVVVLVMARYPDWQQLVYVNTVLLGLNTAINNAVREAVNTEPNTHFVDLNFPEDVVIFQTLNGGHANCRGDKIMANAVVQAMYDHGVIATGLDLGDEATCLARADCEALDQACCQRSAQCYVNPAGVCAPYGPGLQ